jgi:hypothetical protein
MLEKGRGIEKDEARAAEWYRKAGAQGNHFAEAALGLMYRDGRGVPHDDAAALSLLAKAADAGVPGAGDVRDQLQEHLSLVSRISELVKAQERPLSPAAGADEERVRLTHAIVEASLLRDQMTSARTSRIDAFRASMTQRFGPRLADVMATTAVVAIDPDTVMPLFERKLVDALDTDTLNAGLQWERGDVAHRVNQLKMTDIRQNPALLRQFAQLMGATAPTDDARGRACAEVEALRDDTDASLALAEAGLAGGMIAAAGQQGRAIDMNQIRQSIVSMRPMMRDTLRQASLALCIVGLRDLSTQDFEQWLQFLRSDAGGRYARAYNSALRDALLARLEIYFAVLVKLMPEFQTQKQS